LIGHLDLIFTEHLYASHGLPSADRVSKRM
jgi:hypothetical protein